MLLKAEGDRETKPALQRMGETLNQISRAPLNDDIQIGQAAPGIFVVAVQEEITNHTTDKSAALASGCLNQRLQ